MKFGGLKAVRDGGKGGYSFGTLSLETQKNIFVSVGEQGAYGTGSTNTFGGGGGIHTGRYGRTGGGGSDFRLDYNSLFARILVAGGGGGSGGGYSNTGGIGGGITGLGGGADENNNYYGNETAAGGLSTGGKITYCLYGGKNCTDCMSRGNMFGTFGIGGDSDNGVGGTAGGGGRWWWMVWWSWWGTQIWRRRWV